MSHSNFWEKVSRKNPCPKCEKFDNCSVSRDRFWCWCGRESEGSLKTNAGGQYLHKLVKDSDTWNTSPAYVSVKPKKSNWKTGVSLKHEEKKTEIDWISDHDFEADAKSAMQSEYAEIKRQELALKLHVTPESLLAIGVGWDHRQGYWTFPERNVYGSVIGYSRRYPNGSKYQSKGGQRGLIYADSWDQGGDLFLVEGGSDVCALISVGFSVIGRPSNLAGVDLIQSMLKNFPLDRRIIVIGERDKKPDGKFPGRDGAISTATRLAEGLKRPVLWSFPPGEFKDSREWLTSITHSHLVFADDQAKRNLFIKILERVKAKHVLSFLKNIDHYRTGLAQTSLNLDGTHKILELIESLLNQATGRAGDWPEKADVSGETFHSSIKEESVKCS